MPIKLSTTITKIFLIGNSINQVLLREFYDFMKSNGCFEKHINNNLKAIMNFDTGLDPKTCQFFFVFSPIIRKTHTHSGVSYIHKLYS